jgi:hypothetical protein
VEGPLLEDAVLEEIRDVRAWTESDLKPYNLPEGIWHAWFSKAVFDKLDESLRSTPLKHLASP